MLVFAIVLYAGDIVGDVPNVFFVLPYLSDACVLYQFHHVCI